MWETICMADMPPKSSTCTQIKSFNDPLKTLYQLHLRPAVCHPQGLCVSPSRHEMPSSQQSEISPSIHYKRVVHTLACGFPELVWIDRSTLTSLYLGDHVQGMAEIGTELASVQR